MIQKRCSSCEFTFWHNPMKVEAKQETRWRCCYCGFPIGTGPKREAAEEIRKRQVERARAMRVGVIK